MTTSIRCMITCQRLNVNTGKVFLFCIYFLAIAYTFRVFFSRYIYIINLSYVFFIRLNLQITFNMELINFLSYNYVFINRAYNMYGIISFNLYKPGISKFYNSPQKLHFFCIKYACLHSYGEKTNTSSSIWRKTLINVLIAYLGRGWRCRGAPRCSLPSYTYSGLLPPPTDNSPATVYILHSHNISRMVSASNWYRSSYCHRPHFWNDYFAIGRVLIIETYWLKFLTFASFLLLECCTLYKTGHLI